MRSVTAGIICKPLVDRRWPADAGDGECGYMSRVAGQGKLADEERWICSKDPKHVAMTSALKAIKLPEGSPAVRYGFDHPPSSWTPLLPPLPPHRPS